MAEIVSWFFDVICMIIIAIVLLDYDGKPDPRWKIGISIGSFISIFFGFAKSALLLPTAEGNYCSGLRSRASNANVFMCVALGQLK